MERRRVRWGFVREVFAALRGDLLALAVAALLLGLALAILIWLWPRS